MKGIEIIFRGKIIRITQDFHASVFICNKNGRYRIQASGLDEDAISHSWIDTEMISGETVEIEIKKIDKPSEAKSKGEASFGHVVTDQREIEMIHAERLAYFFALEKKLTEEHLLPKEP